MTMTDDALVRDLAERADLAAPPMALDPMVVLTAGRRRRNRVVGARVTVAAGLGVVAVAVAAGAFNPPDAAPPAAATAQLAEGLVATAANDADVVRTDGGDALALTDGVGHRYTVRFDVASGTVDAFEGEAAGAEGDEGWLGGFGASAEGADEGEGILQASGLEGEAILVAGYVSGPGDVRLEWSWDGPTRALDVPTFAVPGVAGRVYIVRIEGAAPDGGWPAVAVVHSGKDEHRADVPLTQLQGTATQTVELAPGVIAANRPTALILEDGTVGVELGISVPEAAATSRPLALLPMTEEQLAEANAAAEPHPSWDGGVQLALLGESDPEPIVAPWVWSSTASPDDDEVRWDSVMRIPGEDSGLFIGVVPSWLTDPRVVLYSRDGFPQADGTVVHTLGAPVYPAPTGDGRLLYTVWIPAPSDGVGGFLTDVDATFAIGSDGTVVGGQRCSDMTVDECADLFGPDIYTATGRG